MHHSFFDFTSLWTLETPSKHLELQHLDHGWRLVCLKHSTISPDATASYVTLLPSLPSRLIMASLSKLVLPRDRTVKSILADLTRLYLSHRTRISRAVWFTLFVALANRIRHAISEQKAASARGSAQRAARRKTTSSGGADAPKKKVELDREFFRALLRLLKIVVPGWRSKEARMLISHTFFLVMRTLISVRVAEMDGAIVKALVKGKGKEFLTRIVWWMLIAIPATFTNSMVCFPLPSRGSSI